MRRTLMLVAIVLGLAAVAAALTPPTDTSEDDDAARTQPTLREPSEPPRGPARPAELRLEASPRAQGRVAVGEPVTLVVDVARAGEVAIPDLGLVGFAEPGTPARFDVLLERPGAHELRFDPVGGEPMRAGMLVARAPG